MMNLNRLRHARQKLRRYTLITKMVEQENGVWQDNFDRGIRYTRVFDLSLNMHNFETFLLWFHNVTLRECPVRIGGPNYGGRRRPGVNTTMEEQREYANYLLWCRGTFLLLMQFCLVG